MELKTARGRLFLLLLLLLTLPMLAGKFHFIKEWELKGDVRNTPKPVFSWRSWWNGGYQEKMNDHLNDSVGGRTWLVRINNQVDYSLFKKLHARDVVMGKKHCLYEKGYIETYCGRDHKGPAFVRDQLGKLKFIQDTLDRLGKKLILVYTPSKARFYPEYLPEGLECQVALPTDYGDFIRIGDSLHIRQLDFNGWFVHLKQQYNSRQLLMSRQGIHWTNFGAIIATDSLQRFMEKELNIDMPDISWKIHDDSYSTDARDADADLAIGLNTLFPVTTEQFCYPEIIVKDDSTKKKPNTVYIGDSFFWPVLANNIVQRTHSDWQFWFYFHDAWGTRIADTKHVRELDWHREMVNADFIVLEYAEVSLKGIGSGFIDAAYDYFTGKQP